MKFPHTRWRRRDFRFSAFLKDDSVVIHDLVGRQRTFKRESPCLLGRAIRPRYAMGSAVSW
jgi:hypothetical protein